MRNKQQTSASTTRPASLLSPPLPSTSPPAPGASSYSSLLTPMPPAPLEKQDSVNPFLYSKEELLQVWKDGGGRGGLGLEVELWEGVVREIGGEPIGLKEMTEGEKKVRSVIHLAYLATHHLFVRVFSFTTRHICVFRSSPVFLILNCVVASRMTSYPI